MMPVVRQGAQPPGMRTAHSIRTGCGTLELDTHGGSPEPCACTSPRDWPSRCDPHGWRGPSPSADTRKCPGVSTTIPCSPFSRLSLPPAGSAERNRRRRACPGSRRPFGGTSSQPSRAAVGDDRQPSGSSAAEASHAPDTDYRHYDCRRLRRRGGPGGGGPDAAPGATWKHRRSPPGSPRQIHAAVPLGRTRRGRPGHRVFRRRGAAGGVGTAAGAVL